MIQFSTRFWRIVSLATVGGLGVAACSGRPATEIESTAKSSAAVSGAADPVPCAALAMAVLANTGGVILDSRSLVDSYSSGLGAYGGSNVGDDAVVHAVTSITNSGGVLRGHAFAHSAAGLAVVPVPSGAINLPLGSATPGSLNINNASGSVTLAPGNYVAANISVNFSGAINVSPPGQVNIWVTGNLNLGGDENLNGVPSNLAFLATSSASVNVNSGGALFGLIYAPTSVVNVDSPIFGSVVGSAVVLNSGSAVHYDVSSACSSSSSGGGAPPPVASQPPRILPLPPTALGCYLGTTNGWVAKPCGVPGSGGAFTPTVEDVIATPDGAGSATTPFQFGQVEATFTAFASESDSMVGMNQFTLQGNTQDFVGTSGSNDWVQFVLAFNGTSATLNIQNWNLDLGTYAPFTGFPIAVLASGPSQFDFATVAGTVFTSGGMPMLGMVAQFSWFDPAGNFGENGLYAMVAPDTLGLAMGNHWNGFSGAFLGAGFGSTANFADTAVLTRTLAGSCANQTIVAQQTSIPWPGVCPGTPALLPDTTQSFHNVSGENNNLCQVGSATPLVAANTNLVYTENLFSTACLPTPACIPNTGRVFVKSTEEDTGARPINFGSVPFWESPDIFIVPTGQPVPVDSVATDIVLTPNTEYDAWIRVHNDFGCEPVTGVLARIFLADPEALSTPWPAGEITGGGFEAGTGQPSDGISVAAGMPGMLGPYTFMAPATGFGNGHRCVLADIMAENEPAPLGADLFSPMSSYKVAQRNLQFDCAYGLTNGTTSNGNVQLTLTVATSNSPPTPFVTPSLVAGGVSASVSFDDATGAWASAWSAQQGAGTLFTVTASGGNTTVRLGQLSVALASVPIAAGESHVASPILAGLPTGVTARLSVQALLTDAVTGQQLVANGGSCQSTGAATPPPPPSTIP